tara:strand:+ start:170 stop:805 length:636 start_codon:yes stop_codon:yes gene_type:complete
MDKRFSTIKKINEHIKSIELHTKCLKSQLQNLLKRPSEEEHFEDSKRKKIEDVQTSYDKLKSQVMECLALITKNEPWSMTCRKDREILPLLRKTEAMFDLYVGYGAKNNCSDPEDEQKEEEEQFTDLEYAHIWLMCLALIKAVTEMQPKLYQIHKINQVLKNLFRDEHLGEERFRTDNIEEYAWKFNKSDDKTKLLIKQLGFTFLDDEEEI